MVGFYYHRTRNTRKFLVFFGKWRKQSYNVRKIVEIFKHHSPTHQPGLKLKIHFTQRFRCSMRYITRLRKYLMAWCCTRMTQYNWIIFWIFQFYYQSKCNIQQQTHFDCATIFNLTPFTNTRWIKVGSIFSITVRTYWHIHKPMIHNESLVTRVYLITSEKKGIVVNLLKSRFLCGKFLIFRRISTNRR